MRLIATALFWLMLTPSVLAYQEYPPFEQTEFRDEYGMFRWWRGCWFRVLHAYAYIICDPSGGPVDRVPLSAIPDLIAAGVLPADSATGRFTYLLLSGRQARTRWSARRLTPASGHGISLRDYYGRSSGNFGGFGGSGFGGSSGGFGGFSGNSFFNGGSSGRGSSSRGGNGGSSGGGSNGGSGGGGSGNTPESLTRPRDLFCESIDDTIDGGALGPIPCTSYPGVFGPKVRY